MRGPEGRASGAGCGTEPGPLGRELAVEGAGLRAQSGWGRTVLRRSFLLGHESFHLQQDRTGRCPGPTLGCLRSSTLGGSEVHSFLIEGTFRLEK